LRWLGEVDACQGRKSRYFSLTAEAEKSLRLALLRRAFYNQTEFFDFHDPNYRAN